MRIARATALLALLSFLLWFQFGQQRSASQLALRARDAFDPRPARMILIVGNSRTYAHDMPAMIRRIADSAASPSKYEIEVDALPGASFESLWNDANTQRLLARTWDDAYFQGESRGQSTGELTASFLSYGARLLNAAKLKQRRPGLIVNWAYDPSLYTDDSDGSGRASHLRSIQDDHALLVERTNTRAINVGRIWEAVRSEHPTIVLTEDGNHPTVAGSYLAALAIYVALSGDDVTHVTYVPEGLSASDSAVLRDMIEAYSSLAPSDASR
jgi:hypothetical protein